MSPMFGCICPNNHMKRRCDKIFNVVNHNPCVGKGNFWTSLQLTISFFNYFKALLPDIVPKVFSVFVLRFFAMKMEQNEISILIRRVSFEFLRYSFFLLYESTDLTIVSSFLSCYIFLSVYSFSHWASLHAVCFFKNSIICSVTIATVVFISCSSSFMFPRCHSKAVSIDDFHRKL